MVHELGRNETGTLALEANTRAAANKFIDRQVDAVTVLQYTPLREERKNDLPCLFLKLCRLGAGSAVGCRADPKKSCVGVKNASSQENSLHCHGPRRNISAI